MPFTDNVDDKTMTGAEPAPVAGAFVAGLAATLSDAACLAAAWGPGIRLGIGVAADIIAPAGPVLVPADIAAAQANGAARFLLTFANGLGPVLPEVVGPTIESLIHAAGTGFCVACLAMPWAGRTMFQGHLFQGNTRRGNLGQQFGAALDGRVGVVPLDIVAAGEAKLRARLAALKDQGFALALIDAVSMADCEIIVAACAGQAVLAGPAWLAPRTWRTEPAPPIGPAAVVSGALDRQTLFQLGAASAAMPILNLDFAKADVSKDDIVPAALAWAAPKRGTPLIISASAPPDRLHPAAPVTAILVEIARGLVSSGITRLVITGSDTAAAIIAALGIKRFTAGAAFGPICWLETENLAILVKPGGAGGRNFFTELFGAGIGPQLRLNAAAE